MKRMINLFHIEVWLVGQEKGETWEIQGIFWTKKKALKICEGNENYFIGPLKIGEKLPNETLKWEGSYFPYYKDSQEI